MNVAYRDATVKDADGIATVEVVSQQSGYREFLPAAHLDGMAIDERARGWRHERQPDDPSRTIVAVHNEKVIGFARADRCKEAGVGGITHLFVLSEYWGMGVGQALMEQVTDAMRALGMASAQLYVYQDNARGRRFYERLGWRPDGRTYTHEFEGKPFLLLCYVRTLGP